MKPTDWKILIASASGNTLEWFNFVAFVFLSHIISALFFPGDATHIALIKTFGIYALGFLARPIGGIIFGYIADRVGRRTNLIASIALMTLSTLGMGLIPTYHDIGIAAPILLIILRTLQGISVGGEYTGAVVYVYEQAPPHRKGFWTSFMPMTIAIGILLGSAVSLLFVHFLSDQALTHFGWRIIFFIGTLFGVIIFWLRVKLSESASFTELKTTQPVTPTSITRSIFTQHLRNLIIIFCLATYNGIKYQILFIWMPTFLHTTDRLADVTALVLNTIAMIIFALLFPLIGYLSDKINKERFVQGTLLFDIIITYPMFLLLIHNNIASIFIALIVMTISFAWYNTLISVIMMTLFPVGIRVSAVSLGYNLAFALFGGTAPLIATWFIYISHNHAAPAYLLILSAIVSLIALAALRRSQRYT